MLLSIIIPVYQVEKYVRGTLESIYTQQYEEDAFEVVVVNNGTLDNSMQIVEEYAACHPNLKIVTIEQNHGLSLGRNAGLDAAQGQFLWHVDSDDTLSQQSLSEVCELIKGHSTVDLFGFDITKVDERTGKESHSAIVPAKNKSLYGQELMNLQICPYVQGPVQRFIFRKDFVQKHRLDFYPEIQHEDMEYLPKVYYYAQSVYISDRPVYRYLLRNTGSLTASLSPKSYPDRIKIIQLHRELQRQGNASKASAQLLNLFVFWIAFFLLSPDKYTILHREDFVSFIKSNSSTIRSAAWSGIRALWLFKEYKRIPLALMLYLCPLSVYYIYYRKGIKQKIKEIETYG